MYVETLIIAALLVYPTTQRRTQTLNPPLRIGAPGNNVYS